MVQSDYIEDIFIEFFELVSSASLPLQSQDKAPAFSFYQVITGGTLLTQNQANYILKILQKYRNMSAFAGIDYSDKLKNPVWKKEFRTLDSSRNLAVSKDANGKLWVDLKFPYALKNHVESAFLSKKVESTFDYEEKIRKIALYDANLIAIYEYCQSEGFTIENSFMDALAEIEEIWQNQDEIIPYSRITNNTVELVNATDTAVEWWAAHATGNIIDDLLLAKHMGYTLVKNPENIVEKIASSDSNSFWMKDSEDFFDICKNVSGKVAIILDRPAKSFEWIKEFSEGAFLSGIDPSSIKVCYREDQHDTSGFNQWVHDRGHSGKIEEGKIFIFNHKPPKWLFKENNSVTIIATNHLYPPTKLITRDWMASHPCVVYLGDIRPSEIRNQNIVNL